MLKSRLVPILACVCFVALAAACGGGGGGDDGPYVLPGVLRAVAVEGDPAPGLGGANFGTLPLQPYMDVAAGGWAAVVAPTTHATKTSVLYVMQPDGTLVDVFAVDDVVPFPGDGLITSISGTWITPTGTVLAHVTIAGDSGLRTFGVLSSVVTGGAATNKAAVIYDLTSLGVAGLPGTLDQVETVTARVENDGTFWFQGRESPSTDWHLLSIDADGTNLVARAARTQTLATLFDLDTIDTFMVDPTGAAYALVATAIGGVERGLFVRSTALGGFVEIMREGDPYPAGGGNVLNIWKNGTLNVSAGRQVIWMTQGTNLAPDDVFMYGDAAGAASLTVISRSGDAAPTAGGNYTTLNGLNQAAQTGIAQFLAVIAGSPFGSVVGTFGVNSLAGPVYLYTAHMGASDIGDLGPTYVSVSATPRYREISANGSHLFANVHTNAVSALLWMIPLEGIFAVAWEGSGAPGGGTFGSFAVSSGHTVANGCALFRASLTGGTTGVWRKGP